MDVIAGIGVFLASVYSVFLIAISIGIRRVLRADTDSVPHDVTDEVTEEGSGRVSVLIPARDEAAGIAACLETVLQNEYPDYEIIVIDDASTDGTPDVVRAIMNRDARVKLVSVSETPGVAHKKRALLQGIKQASGELILQTDADVRVGPHWIESLVSKLDPEAGFVSGPVRYRVLQGFFHHAQALEFLGLVGVGMGAIGLKHPILSSAANMGYRKSVFVEVGGYAGIDHLTSGDDELFMQKIARTTSWKIRFSARPEAVVETDPLPSVAAFMSQRSRWASKGMHYPNPGLVGLLILIFLAYVWFVAGTLAVLVAPALLGPVVLSWLIKVIGEATVLIPMARRYGQTRLLYTMVLAQPLHAVYIIAAAIGGRMGGFTWKGRTVSR